MMYVQKKGKMMFSTYISIYGSTKMYMALEISREEKNIYIGKVGLWHEVGGSAKEH